MSVSQAMAIPLRLHKAAIEVDPVPCCKLSMVKGEWFYLMHEFSLSYNETNAHTRSCPPIISEVT